MSGRAHSSLSHGSSSSAGGLADMCRQLTPLRMMQARQCIEPAIAREAAIHASGQAIIRMKLAGDRAVAAPNWADYETHDDLFHRSVAEAADNILLMALFDQLNQVRRAVAWGNVERNTERPAARSFQFCRTRSDNGSYRSPQSITGSGSNAPAHRFRIEAVV